MSSYAEFRELEDFHGDGPISYLLNIKDPAAREVIRYLLETTKTLDEQNRLLARRVVELMDAREKPSEADTLQGARVAENP